MSKVEVRQQARIELGYELWSFEGKVRSRKQLPAHIARCTPKSDLTMIEPYFTPEVEVDV